MHGFGLEHVLVGVLGDLRRSDLSHVRWLAADINQAPQYTLDAVERVVAGDLSSVRGLVLTLKLARRGGFGRGAPAVVDAGAGELDVTLASGVGEVRRRVVIR